MPKNSKLGIPFPSRTPEYQREWRKLNKDKEKVYAERYREKSREGAWKRRYGITRDDYEKLLLDQKSRCAICYTKKIGRGHKYFHVDHNHITGKVRGLLCDKCNRGLGYFDDAAGTLVSAVIYLGRESEDKKNRI